MAVMTTMRGEAFTPADLAAMPDDGHRYELVDGVLIVTPAPSYRHQRVSLELAVLLHRACPPELKLVAAPFDVALGDATVMQPDLLVARHDDFTAKDLPTPPVLAIEILSPSTKLVDLNLKRARFEAAGVPSYWAVDPDVPRLLAWDLRDGQYVEVADVSGDEEWSADLPFAVTVRPSALLD